MSNVYERISGLLSLMNSNYNSGNEFTVKDMAEELRLPLKLVRSDLAIIVSTVPFLDRVFIVDCEDEEDTDVVDVASVRDGLFDDVVLGFDGTGLFGDEEYLIPFGREEISVVEKMFDGLNPFFKVKKSANDLTKDMREKIRIIDEAKQTNKNIEFDYVDMQGKELRHITIAPLEFRVNAANPSAVEIISEEGEIFAVKDMSHISKVRKKTNNSPIIRTVDNDSVWDLEAESEGEEATYIKLEIAGTNGNLLAKIHADTDRRTRKKWTELQNNVFLYEDYVSGIEGFKRWVMSYGSRVKVLEPIWLADEILEEYYTIKEQYERGCFEE